MRRIAPALQSDINQFIKASWKWLVGRVDYLLKNKTIPGAINPTNFKNPNLFGIGEMFLYHYDPKLKDKLPYYDIFPLVIVIKMYDDGFLGLNLHYLPYDVRIAFLNKLLDLAYTSPGDTRTRLKINYELLRDSSKFNSYIPCLKRYLISHIRGKISKIESHEWLMVCYLPIANWRKTNDQRGVRQRDIWKESMQKIRNRKP